MTFASHASGSSGNLYTVHDGFGDSRELLIVEAGLPVKKIQHLLGWSVASALGCLVSHEHQDHAQGAAGLQRLSVDCYMSQGTARALGMERNYRTKILTAGQQVKIGPLTVLPFATRHDAAEPLGFLIQGPSGKLAYIIDTAYCPNRFAGLTHLAVECNYSAAILDANVAAGRIDGELRNRIVGSHCSLETVLGLLAANDLSELREVHLLHLSAANSDEVQFRLAVQRATGKPVIVAA